MVLPGILQKIKFMLQANSGPTYMKCNYIISMKLGAGGGIQEA
jgi:hypothetical protein